MTWFKETVEDWDMVGQALAARDRVDVVQATMHKFNPDEVDIDEDGNIFIVAEAEDSIETLELNPIKTIQVGPQGIRIDLGLDKETLKNIIGD